MSKRKKQHYIPKFYMRNFSNQYNTFNLVNMDNKKYNKDIPCASQFQEKYYYGQDEIWEKKLSCLESKWAIIFSKIIKDKNYYPNDEEIELIKMFALLQRNRILSRKKDMQEMKWDYAKTILEIEFKNTNNPLINHINNEEVMQEVKKTFLEKHSSDITQELLEDSEKNLGEINDLKLCIINYETNNDLISSDSPIIHYNLINTGFVGLAMVGLILMFPISSKKLIVLYDSKIYTNNIKKIKFINNETEVNILNAFQVISSDKFIFLKDSNKIKDVLKIRSKYLKNRDWYIKQRNCGVFGDDKSKVIFNHFPYINLKYEFSFLKTIPRIKRYATRDIISFTRNKDKKYLTQMDDRIAIVSSNILNKIDIDLGLSKGIKPNIKEMKNFKKFMIDYWNDDL